MRKFLRFRNILIGVILALLIGIGLEVQDDYRQHGKFRTMQDPIAPTEKVDLTGLRDLQVAGGPMLPFANLKKRLNHIKADKVIIDSLQGKYGYVNGIPTSYLGYQENIPSWKHLLWRLFYTGTISIPPGLIIPESKEAEKHGFRYKSFLIASKSSSSDQTIDDFVKFFDTLPADVWVYCHCNHGKGRTSIMLVMLDILKNAPKVALSDIAKRQYLLGSVDLFDTTAWIRGTYAATTLEKRKEFIQKFYEFVCQRKAGGTQQWSKWHRQQQEKKGSMVSCGEKR